jgi:hypothetical protein
MRLTNSLSSALLWSALYALVTCSPPTAGHSKSLRPRQEKAKTPSNPCGLIVDDVNRGFAYHYAKDAYDCLSSVPFNPAVATRFIQYINDTVQFQSTLEHLQSPPDGYQQPAVDILSELTKIQHNVTTRTYPNQYQFEIDVQHLLYRAHDAHLYLRGGITAAFSFLAPYSITSVSLDGTSLPEVYLTSDIIKSQHENWDPSPIQKINNEDVVDYLTKFASLNAFGGIEPHADWNQLFYTPALSTQGTGSIWDSNVMFYPGDSIALTMENGTRYLDYWLALYTEPYKTGPLTTGGDFYNYFVLGLLPASYDDNSTYLNPAYALQNLNQTAAALPSKESWKNMSLEAYPDPDVHQDGLAVYQYGATSGYFLRDVDAAVLSIPSFAHYGYSISNFSSTVTNFINQALHENLTRVVIDLQQNTGGTLELAFSTFKRFFPKTDPYAASRRRNHRLGNIIGKAYTNLFGGLKISDERYQDLLADEWVATSRLNAASNKNFSSWAAYSGPEQSKDGSYSLTVSLRFDKLHEYLLTMLARSVLTYRTMSLPPPFSRDGSQEVILPRLP